MIYNALIVYSIRLLLLWPKNLLNRLTTKDRLNSDTDVATQDSQLLLEFTALAELWFLKGKENLTVLTSSSSDSL